MDLNIEFSKYDHYLIKNILFILGGELFQADKIYHEKVINHY